MRRAAEMPQAGSSKREVRCTKKGLRHGARCVIASTSEMLFVTVGVDKKRQDASRGVGMHGAMP